MGRTSTFRMHWVSFSASASAFSSRLAFNKANNVYEAALDGDIIRVKRPVFHLHENGLGWSPMLDLQHRPPGFFHPKLAFNKANNVYKPLDGDMFP